MTEKRDYYEVLDVTRESTLEQIKSAYRKAALQHHPDRNSGDKQAEVRFKEAAEAYAILSDPDKRSRYDRHGHAGLSGASGFDPGAFAGFEDIFGGIFGDLFGFDARGGRSGRHAARRGDDLRFDLEIEFVEACLGTETSIKAPRVERCQSCAGSGAATPADITVCKTCEGSGQQRFSQGLFTIARTCGSCRGQGRVVRNKCDACRGAGHVQREKTLKLKIPAGVENGSRLRVTGEGDVGEGGPGDLYVFLSVKEHPVFRREEEDLVCTLPITFSQAALGTEMKINGIHGPEKIRIPAGTQSGAIITIRGKGVQRVNGYGKGDLRVEILVRTPARLSREGRKLMERLAETGDDELSPADRGVLDEIS